jgi:hypothetical protein
MTAKTLLLTAALLLPVSAPADNQPPVAEAGPDTTVYTGYWAAFHGSAVDPEGDPIVGWAWEVIACPPGAEFQIAGENSPNLAIVGYLQGDYMISLTVWDGMSARVGVDCATLHVHDNLPPVAVAWADPTEIALGDSVCFDGSQSSDPEGGLLLYLWDYADGTAPEYGSPHCHAYSTPGMFAAMLRVTDEVGGQDTDEVVISVVPADVDESSHPPHFALAAGVPNPSSAGVTIPFELPQPSRARLEVYSVTEARLRVLLDADMPAGMHAFRWDGRDALGRPLPSGIYFCRLQAGSLRAARRMMLVR